MIHSSWRYDNFGIASGSSRNRKAMHRLSNNYSIWDNSSTGIDTLSLRTKQKNRSHENYGFGGLVSVASVAFIGHSVSNHRLSMGPTLRSPCPW